MTDEEVAKKRTDEFYKKYVYMAGAVPHYLKKEKEKMTKSRLTQEIVDYLIAHYLNTEVYYSSTYFSDGDRDLVLYAMSDSDFEWKIKSWGETIGDALSMSLEEARKVYKERLAARIKQLQEDIEG